MNFLNKYFSIFVFSIFVSPVVLPMQQVDSEEMDSVVMDGAVDVNVETFAADIAEDAVSAGDFCKSDEVSDEVEEPKAKRRKTVDLDTLVKKIAELTIERKRAHGSADESERKFSKLSNGDRYATSGVDRGRKRLREKYDFNVSPGSELLSGPSKKSGKFVSAVGMWGDLLKLTPEEKKELLFAAVKERAVAVVDFLIDYGVDVNVHFNDGRDYDWTPLHMAALNGSAEIVKMLLDDGALVVLNLPICKPSTEWPSLTPLYLAKKYNHKEVIEVLEAAGAR